MVKVDIKILDSTTANDVTATKTINDNFEALQNAVEDSLSRSGKVPNYIQTDLDLNHNKLINLADPKEDRDAVTLKYVKDTVGDAKGYADKAEAEAIKANKTVEAARAYLQNSVDEARIWANNANSSAARAQESALEAKEYAEQRISTKIVDVVVPASSWVNSDRYEQYPFQSNIFISQARENQVPNVIFDVNEATSGTFAPIAIAENNTVTIFAKTQPEEDINIPLIILE